MKRFKVGDMVRCIDDGKCFGTIKKGRIYEVQQIVSESLIGVVDKNDSSSIGYYKKDRFELVKAEEKIIVYRDKNDESKVIAMNAKTGEKAEAKCSKNDEFVFEKGASIAFDRLIDKSSFSLTNTEFFTGKVVCIKNLDSFAANWHTVGRVYDVKNGILYDNTVVPWDFKRFVSVDDINNYMRSTMGELGSSLFIKYKGGAE